MLSLAAAALEQQSTKDERKLIWVDIGGGTGLSDRRERLAGELSSMSTIGWNIEQMATNMSIESFETIYLVDFCQ